MAKMKIAKNGTRYRDDTAAAAAAISAKQAKIIAAARKRQAKASGLGGRVANYAGATNKSRGGSIARGTSTYSKTSLFKIAGAAAGKNRAVTLRLNKKSGIYESSSEGRVGGARRAINARLAAFGQTRRV